MTDTRMVDVKYVGKKPIAFDNVADSKKVWNGKGDVQKVTEAQARVLVRYPDQWALVDDADAEVVNIPTTHTTVDENNNPITVNAADLKKPVEKMTKPELVVYAKQKFSKDLDPATGKKLMIDQIEEWEKTLDGSDLVA